MVVKRDQKYKKLLTCFDREKKVHSNNVIKNKIQVR